MEQNERLIDRLPPDMVKKLEAIPGIPVFFFELSFNQHGFTFESLETKEVGEDPTVNQNREKVFQKVSGRVADTITANISEGAERSLRLSMHITPNPDDLRTIAYFPCYLTSETQGITNWEIPVIKSTFCQLPALDYAIEPIQSAIAIELYKLK